MAFALWGGAIAADSGTVSALIYETIKDKEEHKILVSNSEVVRKLMHSVVNFLGSTLYMINIRLPFITSIFLMIIPLITGARIPKAKINKVSKKIYFHKVKTILKDYQFMLEMLSLSLMVSSFSLIFMYQQPRLESIGIEIKYFGLIFGGLLLTGTIGSYYVRYFNLKKSKINSFIILNIAMVVGMYLMAYQLNVMVTIFAMVLLALLNGFVYPLKFIVINGMIDNEIRSGILSIQSYLEFFSKAIISLFIATVADFYSLETAIKLISLVPLLISVIFIFIKCKRVLK